MDLDPVRPIDTSPQELADILFRVGKSLRGKNLRRTSWQEIAIAVSGSGSSSPTLWNMLRNAGARNEAIKVLRLARRQSRHKSSATRNRREVKRQRAWRDDEEAEYDEHREIDLNVCPLCHRLHSWWRLFLDCDDENRTIWWQSLGSYLGDFLRQRPPLILEGMFLATVLPDAVDEVDMAMTDRPSSVAIEERLLEFIECLGRNDLDIRSSLAQSIHDTRFITEWLKQARPTCDVQSIAQLVCLFAPFWVRSPGTFNPRSGTSLFDHLFALYPVPQFLEAEWWHGFRIGSTHRELKWLYWYVLIGHGVSLKRAAKKFGWKVVGRFPHHFEQAAVGLLPAQACLYAEIRQFGGTDIDFRRVLCNPAYVVDPTEPFRDEEFWHDTVRWLIAHRDELDDADADLILTWAMHEFTERKPENGISFWKGRSVPASLERGREYERLRERPWLAFTWAAQGWNWSIEEHEEKWSFVELTSGEELFAEGSALHHCVATYASRCAAGYSAIFSLRECGERCLTIEVHLIKKQIVQARGLCNRAATNDEERLIRRWIHHLSSSVSLRW